MFFGGVVFVEDRVMFRCSFIFTYFGDSLGVRRGGFRSCWV